MKIERKRYVVMRNNRTEIWGGLAQHYRFRSIDDIGDFAIKTYRTEKQAHTCSSWDRNIEVVPIVETITDEEGYRKQSEWISVEERLPEDDLSEEHKKKTIKVLVAIKAKNGITIRTQERFLDYTYSNGGERKTYWTWRFSHGEVTHWMPLPEAPKMKGGGE